jgi:hypothetical protein
MGAAFMSEASMPRGATESIFSVALPWRDRILLAATKPDEAARSIKALGKGKRTKSPARKRLACGVSTPGREA